MFFTHWFELTGVDRLIAPIDDESNTPPPHQSGNNNDHIVHEDDSIFSRVIDIMAPRSPAHPPANRSDAVMAAETNAATSDDRKMVHQHQQVENDPQQQSQQQQLQQQLSAAATNQTHDMMNIQSLTAQLAHYKALTTQLQQELSVYSAIHNVATLTAHTSSAPTSRWDGIFTLFSLCTAAAKKSTKVKLGK